MLRHSLWIMVHITRAARDMVSRPIVIPYTLYTMIHITTAHGNMFWRVARRSHSL